VKIGVLSQTTGIDMVCSQGLYKYNSFPAIIGKEVSGTILALPTDSVALNNETFKKQGFKIGGKVAAVGSVLTNFANWT